MSGGTHCNVCGAPMNLLGETAAEVGRGLGRSVATIAVYEHACDACDEDGMVECDVSDGDSTRATRRPCDCQDCPGVVYALDGEQAASIDALIKRLEDEHA